MVKYIPETDKILLSRGDYLNLQTGFYKYMGNFKTIDDVPKTSCLYTINNDLYIRRVDLYRLQMMKVEKEKSKKEIDDSNKLDLAVNPGDDTPLIIVKELLKGFTKNTFRKLFEDDSDMNNMRRAIEKSPNGQLSLNRFRDILDKLGLKYKIFVYEDSTEPNEKLDKKLDKLNKQIENNTFKYNDTDEIEEDED